MVDLNFHHISEKLKSFPFPKTDLVVGIATGGVIPASIIAHQLGCELQIISIAYRDQDNVPLYDAPALIDGVWDNIPEEANVLLVDDVSVTGKTLALANSLLKSNSVTTFTLKGTADLILFPEVTDCVNWPWKRKIEETKHERPA